MTPLPAVIHCTSPVPSEPSTRSRSEPSSTNVTVSNPACGCASPAVLPAGSSIRSSASMMNGSCDANLVGSTTRTAVCPAPMKPGEGAGVWTTRAMRREVDTLRRPQADAATATARRQIANAADGADGQRDRRECRRPQRLEAEQRIQREEPRTGERKRDGDRRVEQRQLDAVRRGKESVAPVHRDGGDDHHGEHECRPDGAEEADGDEKAGDELCQ